MAEYVYTMSRVSKIVPPKRQILKDISLSFFPGAKIGVLGLNGAGKSTLLRIMAGIDKDIDGEARPQPGLKVGYLPKSLSWMRVKPYVKLSKKPLRMWLTRLSVLMKFMPRTLSLMQILMLWLKNR